MKIMPTEKTVAEAALRVVFFSQYSHGPLGAGLANKDQVDLPTVSGRDPAARTGTRIKEDVLREKMHPEHEAVEKGAS